MTAPPPASVPPFLLASGPTQRRPPLAPLANALVVSSSSSSSRSSSSSSASTPGDGRGGRGGRGAPSSAPPLLPPLPPLLAYLGDPATLSLLDPESGSEVARLELDPEGDELCAAAWQHETSEVVEKVVEEEEGGGGDRGRGGSGRRRREGRLFVATRTRLLLVEAWAASEAGTEAAAAERDGEGRRRGGPAASLCVSASQRLHFWPKALAVRSASAAAAASDPASFAVAVEVAVAGGPGVVLFSLSHSPSPPPPAPSAAAARRAPSPSLPFSFSRLRTLCSPWPACAACYSRGGEQMAAAGPAGQLWIWGEGSGGEGEGNDDCPPPLSLLLPPLSAPLLHAQVPHERVTALEFSPCGSELAVACWGGAVLLYSRKKEKKRGEEETGGGKEEKEELLPPPLLPAGLTSGPAILALEPSADDGGPPASDWELSGGIRPATSAPASSAASSASGPRATLLAWRKEDEGKSSISSPSLLAVARAGRSLAVVSVEEKGRSRECRVAWEAPAGVVVVESTGGEEREKAETREENGGDGRGPLPEGLPSLRLPARAAAGAGGKGALPLPLPPAPALPLPAGVRGLAVCDEGGSTILWCDGEGRLGRARW